MLINDKMINIIYQLVNQKKILLGNHYQSVTYYVQYKLI